MYFVEGIRSTVLRVFWPIFIFSLLGGYLSLGIYSTVVAFLVAIFAYFLGEYSDRLSKTFLVRVFAPIEAVLWVLRIFVSSVFSIFLVGSLGLMARTGIDIPLLAKTYVKASKEDITGFIVFREVSLRLGQIFVLVFMLIFADIKYSFVLAALSSLAYLLV